MTTAQLALQMAALALLVAFGAVALVMRLKRPDVFEEEGEDGSDASP